MKNTDVEKPAKEKEYMDYIDHHIANVKYSFNNCIDKPDIVIPGYNRQRSIEVIERLYLEVSNHDASKYSEEEFDPYRRHFYPTEIEKKIGETDEDIKEFEEAWFHHFINNSHHPLFFKWVTINERDSFGCPLNITVNDKPHDPIDMDDINILHMLCDWQAMSMNPGNSSIIDYWASADEKNDMSDITVQRVNELIKFFFMGD